MRKCQKMSNLPSLETKPLGVLFPGRRVVGLMCRTSSEHEIPARDTRGVHIPLPVLHLSRETNPEGS